MIRVHQEPRAVTFAVDGRATTLESRAVQETVEAELSRGVSEVRVDLRDCTTMDSTFSGTLLALKRRLEQRAGRLVLVSPSARAVELLRQMGLEDFYVTEVAPRAGEPWRELAPAWPRPEDLTRLVLDAHDELANVPGVAARTFRPVVEELRRNVRP